jgi:hypothetical protein
MMRFVDVSAVGAVAGSAGRVCRPACEVVRDAWGEEGEDVLAVVVVSLSALVVVVVVVGGGGDGGLEAERRLPKGVFSSFSLEEDATDVLAGCCVRGDSAVRTRSLR